MLAIVNARIHTMQDSAARADAMLIDGGAVRWIGDAGVHAPDLGDLGATRAIDMGGDTIIPGLVDAHTHLEQIAYAKHLSVDCRSAVVSSIEDMVARIRERCEAVPPGEWVFAQGEHYQELSLAEGRLPDRVDLDRASTTRPVVYRSSYHTNVFNSLGLQLLGVTASTPDAPGGRIERDSAGQPTGRTFDMFAAIGGPEATVDALAEAISDVQSSYLALGVTSLGDLPLHRNGFEAVQRLDAQGRLRLRVALYPKMPTVVSKAELSAPSVAPTAPQRSSVVGTKIFLDGGLTAAAAALHEPYPDRPDSGEILYTEDELIELIELSEAGGRQLAVHAIGDRALDHALQAFESYARTRRTPRVRHRIEHAGNIFLDDARQERVRRLGLIPVPQPSFLLTTADGYRAYLGDRINPLMPFRSMIARGLVVPGSSDAIGISATQHHPFPAMDAAITRRSRRGASHDDNERVTPRQALLMYTRHGAAALGWETRVGELSVGSAADFVRLGSDPLERGAFEGTSVLETWIGGEQVYAS